MKFFVENMCVGPPPKPLTNYGPPKPQFSGPKPVYGLPQRPAVNFKPQPLPQSQYGPPPPLRQPLPVYGPPQLHQQPQPLQPVYGLPPQPLQPLQSLQSEPSLPNIHKPIHGAGCDGWKPIPGPSIGTQALAHSNTATINALAPENTYLPPPSNNFPANDIHLQVQPLPSNLQLPVAEPINFNNHADLGANLASGLGITTLNVVKSEGIEVRTFS